MRRREALRALVALVTLPACGAAASDPKPPSAPKLAKLHVAPATDLLKAPALRWLADVRPRDIFADTDLIPAVAMILPEKSFPAFTARNGGIDPRELEELVVAVYEESQLIIGRGFLDPGRVAKAFADRADDPNVVRAEDHASAPDGTPYETIARLLGAVHHEPEQLGVFGTGAVALERGKPGALRAASAFAQGKLKKAKPALKAEPLERAAELLGDAPLRGFAPGPFVDEWKGAFGGLLGSANAAALSVKPARGDDKKALLAFTLVLTGSWGADAEAAGARLKSWYGLFGSDALGALCGADAPVAGPTVTTSSEAIILQVSLDAMKVAKGIHAATGANVDEIMAR